VHFYRVLVGTARLCTLCCHLIVLVAKSRVLVIVYRHSPAIGIRGRCFVHKKAGERCKTIVTVAAIHIGGKRLAEWLRNLLIVFASTDMGGGVTGCSG
jgi:hypothetical protein